jgi:ribose transport system substrate-binding protein
LPGPEGGRQAVADGRLQATFVYPTGGREAVEMAAKLLAGEQVPRQITLDTERITRVTGK